MLTTPLMDRRQWLQSSGAVGLLGLGGCATASGQAGLIKPDGSRPLDRPPIYPIHASPDRIFDITVCLRPFRAAGPRLDTEHIGDALVVHNYGHGGSGWSLS